MKDMLDKSQFQVSELSFIDKMDNEVSMKLVRGGLKVFINKRFKCDAFHVLYDEYSGVIKVQEKQRYLGWITFQLQDLADAARVFARLKNLITRSNLQNQNQTGLASGAQPLQSPKH